MPTRKKQLTTAQVLDELFDDSDSDFADDISDVESTESASQSETESESDADKENVTVTTGKIVSYLVLTA